MLSTSSARDARPAEPVSDSTRIDVQVHTGGYSLEILGVDPDTRYIPRPRAWYVKLFDRIRIGLLGPDSVRKYGP